MPLPTQIKNRHDAKVTKINGVADIDQIAGIPNPAPTDNPEAKIRVTSDDALKYIKAHKKQFADKKITPRLIRKVKKHIQHQRFLDSLPKGRDLTVTDTVAPWQIVYGKCRVGGVLSCLHETNNKLNLNHIITYAAHECTAVDKLYLNDVEVKFEKVVGDTRWAYTANTADPSYKYNDKVFLASDKLGTAAQTAQADAITQMPGVWTSDHRQRNRALVFLQLLWNAETFSEGQPEVELLVRGKPVYDPRTGTTAYSANPALIIADFLMDPVFGYGCSLSDIDTTSLGDAATICDQVVTKKDASTEARYEFNGYFDSEKSPQEILEAMCQSMAGEIVLSAGKWRFLPGTYRTPEAFTLTEDDLRSVLQLETLISAKDSFNSYRGTYVNALNNYTEEDFPAASIAAYVTEDNSNVYWHDFHFIGVTSYSMAQRIARIELERVRRKITLTASWGLKAYQLNIGDNVPVTLARYGFSSKIFTVDEWELSVGDDGELVVNMVLRENDSGVFTWTPASDEQTVTAAPVTTLPSSTVVASPTSLTLASGTTYLDIRADGTVFSRIYASWVAPADPYVTSGGLIEIQYKKNLEATWRDMTPVPGSSTYVYILDVLDLVQYDVRIRAVNALGTRGDWVTATAHTVVGKTAKPSDVTGFSAVVADYGIALTWTAVSDLDVKEYEIRVGASWAAGTLVAKIKTTSYAWAYQAAGSYTLRIKAVDTTGNYSTNDVTSSVTITAPTASTFLAVLVGPELVLSWTVTPGSFAIKQTEIRYGTSWAAGTSQAVIKAVKYTLRVNWSGDRTYRIKVEDVAGNLSTEVTNLCTIVAPGAVENLRGTSAENNIMLDWDAPLTGSLPIDHYNIYKGASFAGARLIGQVGGTFGTYIELVSGTFTYFVSAVDTAGTESSEVDTSVYVYDPPNFVVNEDLTVQVDRVTAANVSVEDVGTNLFDSKPSDIDAATAYKLWIDANFGLWRDWSTTEVGAVSPLLYGPYNYDTCQGWWEADYGTGANPGDLLSSWTSRGAGARTMTQATAGNKPIVSRFDAKENRIPNSEAMNVGWVTAGRGTTQSNPTFDVLRVTEDSALSTHDTYSAAVVPVAAGAVYVSSISVKKDGTRPRILFRTNTDYSATAILTLATGATSSVSGCTAVVEDEALYWRLWLTWTAASTANAVFRINLDDGAGTTYQGDGVKYIELRHPQIQSALADRSYVATESTMQMRGINGRQVIWFDGVDDYLQSTATWADVVSASDAHILAVIFPNRVGAYQEVIDGSAGSQLGIRIKNSGSLIQAYHVDSGGADYVEQTIAVNQPVLIGWRHDSTNQYISVNGVESAAVATGALAALTETLRIGCYGSGSNPFDGAIAAVGVFAAQLSAQHLAAAYEYLGARYQIPGLQCRRVYSISDLEGVCADFKQSTVAAQPTICEADSENWLSNSELLNASTWNAINSSQSRAGVADPHGGGRAWTILGTGSTARHGIERNESPVRNAVDPFYVSAYLKAGTCGYCWFGFAGDGPWRGATINLTTGAIVQETNIEDCWVEPKDSGWWLVTIKIITTADSIGGICIYQGTAGGSSSPPSIATGQTIYAYQPQARDIISSRDYRGTYGTPLRAGINNRRALLFDTVHCLNSTTTLATIFAAGEGVLYIAFRTSNNVTTLQYLFKDSAPKLYLKIESGSLTFAVDDGAVKTVSQTIAANTAYVARCRLYNSNIYLSLTRGATDNYENKILQSDDIDHSDWSVASAGTGVNPTRTINVGTNDNGKPYHRIQFNRGATDTSGNYSTWQTTASPTYSNADIFSFRAKSNDANTYVLKFSEGGYYTTVTVTPSWQTFSFPLAYATTTLGVLLRGGYSTSQTADILISEIQLKSPLADSTYVRTKHTAVFMVPSEASAACGNIASRTGTLRIGETSSGFRGRIAAILARDSWNSYQDSLTMAMLTARYLMPAGRLLPLGAAYGFWAPRNIAETYEQHFTQAGATSMQDLVTAGHTIAGLPGYSAGGTASIEYLIDYGIIFAENTLNLTWTLAEFGNRCIVKPTISVSADGVTWDVYPAQAQVFAIGFRYVKIKIEVTAPDAFSVCQFTSLRLVLRTKKQTEIVVGLITDTAGAGTTFNLSKLYYSVSTVQVTVTDSTGGFAVPTSYSGENPTSFTAIAWDKDGARASRNISAYVEGIGRTS